MDLLIPNNWLKKFLDTKANPSEFTKYMSLSGPSVEKITKCKDGDYVYSIEVTTNRIDTASILGIAREASAILPRFGIEAKFKKLETDKNNFKFLEKVDYLKVSIDNKLCFRFTAALIENVEIKESSNEIKSLLKKVGVRPINNVVDVSNFIMHEIGQPVHTFDYDKIKDSKMILRESKTGEEIITLDNKNFKLNDGDIVIEDGSGKLIDLCGIMGGKNSAVCNTTKNVLIFVQTYNKNKIRQTSMNLAQRTEAASLFEKGLDEEMVKPAILSAIKLLEKTAKGKTRKEIIDIYKKPYKQKFVSTDIHNLKDIIGIYIPKEDITNYLKSLKFDVFWNKNNLKVGIPSFRANDINIAEDIAEEIARIYGYHNLPNQIMNGEIPNQSINLSFQLENKIKQTLISLGGYEVYTLSLVSEKMSGENALELKNPLGPDTKYLRTSLKPSLIECVKNNSQEKGSVIHFFEIANIYLFQLNTLPEERLMLSGIIKNKSYRESKGIIEILLERLSIDYTTKIEDGKSYLPNQKMVLRSNKVDIGEYGNLENGMFYYELDIEKLIKSKKIIKKYQQVSKFPSQIEDLTLYIPPKTYIGEVLQSIKVVDKLIENVELKEIFENNHTFRIWYHHLNKTLTDKEVEKIRNKILKTLKSKFTITAS